MTPPVLPCRREAAALSAARHGRTDSELAAHVRGCAACMAATAAGAALRQAAATFTAEASLPHPRQLLHRAAEERRRLAAERAFLPLRLAHGAAAAAGAGAAVVLLPLLLPHLHWRELAIARNLLPSGGQSWVALSALLLAVVVGALWLHWEEA